MPPKTSFTLSNVLIQRYRTVRYGTVPDFPYLRSVFGITWLQCLTASTDLENAIGPLARDQLAGLIDLPPALGGIGLQSLERSAYEELLGSFAGISASLTSFCMST